MTPDPSHAQTMVRQHLPELDGFRALSILAVLAAHMLPLGPSEWQLNSVAGHMGMSIFFCLSGFLITQFLWMRPDIPTFLARRFARIAPLILLASTIFCLLVEFRPESFIAINLYFFNYADYAIFPGLSPLWSVAMEMQFYVGIAFLVLVLRDRAFLILPFIALLVTGFRIYNGEFSTIRTHGRVDEILAGCLLALVWVNQTEAWARRITRVLGKLFYPMLALWALSCWPEAHVMGYARPYLSAGLVSAILFSDTKGPWHRFLSTRTLAYIATISFALYVWHSPFRVGWFEGTDAVDRYLIKRPLGLLASFALAHLSTFYFEKPVTDWVRRRTGRRKPRAA